MFHPEKVAAKIAAIEAAKKIKLVQNSVEDCIKLYDHFKSLEYNDGRSISYARPGQTPAEFEYTEKEQQWIQNEMYVCACSFPYWFYRYFFIKSKIKDKDGEVVEETIKRPNPWISQKIYLAILAALDLAGLPMLLLILKARQLGLSTITEAIILWIAIFRKAMHTVVASAEEEKSEEMANMVWLGLEMLPMWMQPTLTRDNRQLGPEFGLIHSDISIQHGSQTKGISRGSTPDAAHLCLRGDALVFSEDGNLIPIDNIKVGDKVWTHTGKASTVKAISKRPSRKRKLLQVNTWMNCEPLHLTADHKVWTSRGWVQAINLIRGKDEIGTAIRPITGEIDKLFTEEVRDSWGRIKRGKSGIQEIPLTREFGFFCGYYLAEGNLGNQSSGGKHHSITLSHHVSESSYSHRAKMAVDKYVTSHKTKPREGTKTGITTIYGTSLAELIFKEFGSVNSKKIPDWVFRTNQEFIKGIIIGYLSGDGSKTIQNNNPSLYATSVRPRLLYQFRHLLASVGWGWGGITKESAFIDDRGWNNKESWTLTISGMSSHRLRKEIGIETISGYKERTCISKYRIEGGWVWCKVKDFCLSFASHVWDIEVDSEDHSFETVVGAVANSEVAFYPNPISTIESSLIRAMHENPNTFLALESTALIRDDWFHRTWKKNRKGEQTGYRRFTCIFLPWYVGRDIYPTSDWLRNHPIPQNWNPLKETVKQAADARLYVATTELLRKHMPPDWEMPIEQMWYWEFNYVEAKEGGDKTYKSFLAELASDERSAFQGKKLNVFSQEEIDDLEEKASEDCVTYAMTGDGIDQKYALKEFQSHSRRRVEINYRTIEGKTLVWNLVPLREVPRDENLNYYLTVWEEPKPGFKYSIGIDIASGIGQNNTVYFVNRIGRTADEPDLQVAEIYSPWIASPETPGFALMLGAWYGTYMEPVKEAMIAPEVQKAVGDFISFQLDKVGYSNFFYMKRYDLRKHPGSRPTRRGWASVGWSQQMMKESFEHGIKAGWIEINSKKLVEELSWLEAEESESGKMSYDHARDQTDDAYVAGGISYMVSHDEQTIMDRVRRKLKPTKKAAKEIPLQSKESGLSLLARQLMREDRDNYPQVAEEVEVRNGKSVF